MQAFWRHIDIGNTAGLSILVWLVVGTCTVAAQRAWQPEQFPVSYWHGPPASQNKIETWQTVKDCNFTVCGPRGGYTVEQNQKLLDLCEQVGLKAMVTDGRIGVGMVAADDWQERIDAAVADYGQHPALYGYFIDDEPNYSQFRDLGRIVSRFQEKDPAHLPYINLFPTYANTQQLGTPTYADHLDKYMSIVRPPVLSYDHYCLMRGGGRRASYFENLGLIREYAQKYGVPPWNIILSMPHFGYRDPTAAEMRWQVYTSLAYGMKGIMYFTYWTVDSWAAEGHIAIVDSDGEPARLYPIVQELNGEIQALGTTLLGLESTGVFHTGEIPVGERRLGTDPIVQLPEDVPLLIGFFVDEEENEYAMIVNRDYDEAVEFEAELLPHIVGVSKVSPESGQAVAVELAEHTLPLRLEAGGGVLLKLQTQWEYPKPPEPLTSIGSEFETAEDLSKNWSGFNDLSNRHVSDGILRMTVSGADAYMTSHVLRLQPDQYSTLIVRMKIPAGDHGQVFWTTSKEPRYDDEKYVNFDIVADGEWHEYEISLAEHDNWKGHAVRGIRLDPVVGSACKGQEVEIDWIRAK